MSGVFEIHFTVLSLVSCVVVASATAVVACYAWLAARRRSRHQDEWARVAAELSDLEHDLDLAWAEEGRSGRYR
jgi:hypothetical protein